MSKKEGGRKGRCCAPQARHSLSHDAAAGGASAERAESVESTESEESVETGKAGQHSQLCEGGLKDKERRIGGRIGEKRGGEEGGDARRKRVAHIAKAQQRVQRAKMQPTQGDHNELCDGGFKMTKRKGGEGAR
jgi:hypothetical protein